MRINPVSLRLVNANNWHSQWYSQHNYAELASRDHQVRSFVQGLFYKEGLVTGEINILRTATSVEVSIEIASKDLLADSTYAALEHQVRVGISRLEQTFVTVQLWLLVLCKEKVPMSATLLAKLLASKYEELQYLAGVEREFKMLVSKLANKGVRVEFSGRFSKKGRRAKRRVIQVGIVPVQSIRASIDYCCSYAVTRYGCIGIKVWLHTK